MAVIKGDKLYVNLSASQARRRLKGLGFGIRKIQSAGRNRAVIIHTATGDHLRELRTILDDVLAEADDNEPRESVDEDRALLENH